MVVVEPAASSKLGQTGSSHFWSFKQNHSTASLKNGKENRAHGTLKTPLYQSASYTHLALAPDTFNLGSNTEKPSIKRTFSENTLPNLENGITLQLPSGAIADRSAEESRYNKLLRRKSSRFQNVTKLMGTKITLAEQQANPELAKLSNALSRDGNPERQAKLRPVSNSLSNLARTWIGASRSPSPNKRHSIAAKSSTDDLSMGMVHRRRLSLEEPLEQKKIAEKGSGTTNGHVVALEQKDTTGKKTRRPLSTILGKPVPLNEDKPTASQLSRSISRGNLTAVRHERPALNPLPPVLPRSVSTERMSSFGSDTPRKRDELWSSFRALDGEFQKFISKPTTFKVNIIRGSLLPFLRTYVDHHSNASLRAEDLERRVSILNQWWIGLLEMLSGRNGQAISGTDRPAILEGVAGIMVRPEWRLPISSIHCRAEKSRSELKSKSSTSLDSTSSVSLAESVFQTVRNSFVRNLLSQMGFVVERMSLRNVPASVVAFCGKAIAYAFFFCPGIADILVRLWSLSMDMIRRVLGEMDITKDTDNVNQVADRIVNGFPSHLRGLAFRSLPSLMKHLRCRSRPPTGCSDIPWYGPWLGRWAGRDSDLFFVFVKHHHILVCDMLPDDATEFERTCAPSYILVHSQLLTVLDATIHRTIPPQIDSSDASMSISIDDILVADTTATPLPLPRPNPSRLMAENRLIMLLRELLSDMSGVKKLARASFARSFSYMLKAAARRTSMFDHNACFTLCDFLEEAITILARYHSNTDDPILFLDWIFWREVLEQMMKSNNSMTEVRLYAFIYSLWGFIAKDKERRRQITVDWLLTEDHFQRQFNHWCPMVRAYYLRLLCWRVARFDGEPCETDLLIYTTLSLRLRQTWCHLIYAQNNAKKHGTLPPSTTPCNPAPGRRLLIVRNDVYTSLGGVFTSFDGILAASDTSPSPAHERQSFLNPLKDLPNVPQRMDSARSSNPGRKRWSVLRTMNPFNSTQLEPSKISTSTTSDNAGSTRTHGSVADLTPPVGKSTAEVTAVVSEPDPQHQHLSFKFSLEWNSRTTHSPREHCLYPPKLPLPAQIFLQSKRPEPREFYPSKPEGVAAHTSKYSGRALAEWAVLVNECQNFFERRKYEGVLGLKRVETPTLGVEAFRRPG